MMNEDLPDNVKKSLKARKETTSQKKQRFIKEYAAKQCNVSKACKVVGISRTTYYKWMDKDDKFKKSLKDAEEDFFDTIEATMFTKATKDKDTTMLIWLSKTKMKHRGYVERQEQEVTINPFEELMKAATSSEDD